MILNYLTQLKMSLMKKFQKYLFVLLTKSICPLSKDYQNLTLHG